VQQKETCFAAVDSLAHPFLLGCCVHHAQGHLLSPSACPHVFRRSNPRVWLSNVTRPTQASQTRAQKFLSVFVVRWWARRAAARRFEARTPVLLQQSGQARTAPPGPPLMPPGFMARRANRPEAGGVAGPGPQTAKGGRGGGGSGGGGGGQRCAQHSWLWKWPCVLSRAARGAAARGRAARVRATQARAWRALLRGRVRAGRGC
jgi:hypothetical protein